MEHTADAKKEIKPPVATVGALGWVRTNLFNSALNSFLTILVVVFLWKVIPPLFQWAFIDSLWTSSPEACRDCPGACWSVIYENMRFMIFGFYPHDEHWRPLAAMIILVSLLLYTRDRRHWSKFLAYAWVGGIVSMLILMRGGIFGLTPVESNQWSGLPLTLILAVVGMAAAYPFGVVLALGRQSKLPIVRLLSVLYIEIIRGVPFISMLFMSSILFPLFLPEGVTINKIVRAQGAIIMFTAAYIAEVVRGGLQAIKRGQYEAAESLGLTYSQKMRLIILPQALKIVIPPSVGILISAFKDTSLVVIIALFDLMKTTQVVLSNPNWMSFSTEAYIFIAILYFTGCFTMARYSRRLEKELEYES